VIVSFAVAIVGQEIAHAGFAIIQPVSFLDEEVAKDAGSPIAVGREIREKNRTVPPPPWALRLALPLIPAALMALPIRGAGRAAAIVYGSACSPNTRGFLSTLPAYAPLTRPGSRPDGAPDHRRVARPRAASPRAGSPRSWSAARRNRAGRARPVAGLTSPGR